MPTLRDIRRKIAAVKKTQQITKAMNMVAAAKLRGAQQRMESFRPYAATFAKMLGNLASRIEPEIHPFFQRAPLVEKVALVLMTADRGLCGSFNVNLINAAVKFARQKEAEGIQTAYYCVGRKGRDFFRRRKVEMPSFFVDVWNKFDFTNAVAVTREVISAFLSGAVQEVYLMLNGEARPALALSGPGELDASQPALRLDESIELTLDKDAWVAAVAYGPPEATLNPVFRGARPAGATNAVLVDVDGNGRFDPPEP